jgi:hypothetical protein
MPTVRYLLQLPLVNFHIITDEHNKTMELSSPLIHDAIFPHPHNELWMWKKMSYVYNRSFRLVFYRA